MRNRLLACLLCLVCSLGGAHPIDFAAGGQLIAPACDDDELADYFQQHVALGSGTIRWQVLQPDLGIVDRDTVPLLVIGALWIAFLAALGIARWRERPGSKIVE